MSIRVDSSSRYGVAELAPGVQNLLEMDPTSAQLMKEMASASDSLTGSEAHRANGNKHYKAKAWLPAIAYFSAAAQAAEQVSTTIGATEPVVNALCVALANRSAVSV